MRINLGKCPNCHESLEEKDFEVKSLTLEEIESWIQVISCKKCQHIIEMFKL